MQDQILTKDLEKALRAGYIDSTTVARQDYKPKLLLNDAQQKTKVLTTILSELRTCDEFAFSVAFVTNSGVEVIIDALKELEHKQIKGRILASSYQNFTEPRALRRLLRFPNIELKIQTENNFHAKGYIFQHGEGHTLIVGSSNLTQNALCANNEWNLRVTSFTEGSIVSDIRSEFDRQFASATVVDEDWLLQYTRIYRAQRIAQIRARSESEEELAVEFPLGFRPSPNTMQKEALEALQVLRAEGQDRALLISATGTGKTYLSAFDASAFDAKRVLFVIHRENIARAAMKTFRTVFGNTRTMGFYGGSEHDTESDFIFTTVQTMSRPDHYTKFDPDTFDYICIDEVHRSGAESYQRLIHYFTPKFLLGMSATPERTDGIDIFKTFNYNIAYEIRLQDALEAAKEMGDKEFATSIETVLPRLRGYHISAKGTLQEWYHDWADLDPRHRHQSHLIGVYPGHQIQAGTPLAEAALKTLEIRGFETTGWSCGWRVNLYARLGDGESAYKMYRRLLRYVSPDGYQGEDARRGGGTYPNLMDAHSPFQIDGNFGGCAGVMEMLVRSDARGVQALPALPSAWPSGHLKGVRTRTGQTVDMAWKDGKVTRFKLH